MSKIKKIFNYFTFFEKISWLASVTVILAVFFAYNTTWHMALGSIIGITMILFNAKGNPIGQVLAVVFSLFYAIVSLFLRLYGEVITYAGMTLPMAIFALISWCKNPYKDNKAEIKINKLSKKDALLLSVLTLIITISFYFILKFFDTPNLFVSTFSVTTSFIAVFLTNKRSPFFSLAYALNDLVLIVLWSLVSANDLRNLSMVVCFIVFLYCDLYAFINLRKIQRKQLSNV